MLLDEIKILLATSRRSVCLAVVCFVLGCHYFFVGSFVSSVFAQTRQKQTRDEESPFPVVGGLGTGTTIDGSTLYTKMCAHCHGLSGVPPENITKLLSPPPSDLTAEKYKHGDSEKEIAESIRQGIGSNMLRFKERLSEEQISAVTKFVISLKGSRSDKENEKSQTTKKRQDNFD